MTMALVIESAIFSFLADEKMYEELISGYKENKERESDRKAVTRKLQKSIRENKKQEQRRDEERELAHLHMGGGL
ncbi:MAG: hypothetical protein QG654_31 [Patescibacteria group bacterium]|nr:hypothetical protein [Patescibacteria group bacterium]